MGKTTSEKILAKASGRESVSAGEIVWVNADRAMMDDILGPRIQIAEKMKLLGAVLWDPERTVVIADHYTPPASTAQAEIVKFTRDWAAENGISNYHEFVGPCHQIMAENGHFRPGTIVLGTDSHTCMGGAFGAFATGIGSTEMLGVLVTGQTWLKVPETIRIRWRGRLQKHVYAKDMALEMIRRIGHAGATYRALEYTGETISALGMDERMAITNMAVECGAKVGLMEPDTVTERFLRTACPAAEYSTLWSDPDAAFEREMDFDAGELAPLVACPHAVDNVHPAATLNGIRLHQVYLGSCTGGRLHDLEVAAAILRGRRIAAGIRFLVSPASAGIWREAAGAGILGTLADAGATILAPTCGVCVGVHSGLLAEGERCLSTTNRNFQGRMGSKKSEIYLASAATAAASAITGYITDPRSLDADGKD